MGDIVGALVSAVIGLSLGAVLLNARQRRHARLCVAQFDWYVEMLHAKRELELLEYERRLRG